MLNLFTRVFRAGSHVKPAHSPKSGAFPQSPSSSIIPNNLVEYGDVFGAITIMCAVTRQFQCCYDLSVHVSKDAFMLFVC